MPHTQKFGQAPEYFKDMQDAKGLGGTIEYHPWYTAYAFKWTGDRRQATWPSEVAARLKRGEVAVGDDVFMIVSALGPPSRVVINNWGSVLAYPNGTGYVVRSGKLNAIAPCPKCTERSEAVSPGMHVGMRDEDVIATMRNASK